MALNMHKKGLAISKTISDCKKWKIWKIFCLQAVNWRQKWTTGVRHGTSLVVRRVWWGRPIVVLFWTKYAFPCQIKPRILKLTTSKGHSNLLTVFTFVNCEEKGYYRVVSVGHLSFDCHSYCGRSCRMQGGPADACFVQPVNMTSCTSALLLTCEKALYLGLTRDLFWARAANGHERIGRVSRAAARGLGRGRTGKSLPPWQEFSFPPRKLHDSLVD